MDVETETLLYRIPDSQLSHQETLDGIEQVALSLDTTFLQGGGQLLARGDLGVINPRIRRGEMSKVCFIVNYRRYVNAGVHLRNWLVTSVNTAS